MSSSTLVTIGDPGVTAEIARLKAQPYLAQILNALPSVTFVVNSRREVVLGNEALAAMLGPDAFDAALGHRHGDLLGCANAVCSEGGCGSTQACRVCGAIGAIRESQQHRKRVERECHLSVRSENGFDSREFLVSASPLTVDDRWELTVVSLLDISDEKRRRTLERIFFHDVINAASGVLGLIQHAAEVADATEKKALLGQLETLTEQLVDEIQAQRDLLAAESNDLVTRVRQFSSLTVLREAVILVENNQQTSVNKHFSIDPHSADIDLASDRRLLKRVLVNLLKNAAEASAEGQTISCGCTADQESVEFWVHNHGVILDDHQLQIFSRAFSTKGAGRGIGTYSVKLLSERYLRGSASFSSTPEHGTTFRVRYPLRVSGTAPL